MIQVNIPAAYRNVFGKGESRRLRMNNFTPAVVYSGGSEALALQLDAVVLHKNLLHIHGQNAVITLRIEGDQKGDRHVLVKEVQKSPVTDRLVHVDFHEIDLEKPIEFKVPLKYKGTAKGVDLGGELMIARNSLHLRGCPLDIPDFVEIDITPLDRGDKFTFGDIPVPDKVDLLENKKTVCIAVN
ncbi:MAG: 50S ribosomal protein L25 [Desulfobulbaceae bacterium]|nr:50S ribosomal protein L25 [Desulfobulbaceae bacterium]